MATQTKEVATQEKAVVKWKGETITITFRDVKNLICPLATDQETAVFIRTCQSLQLNPFAGEVYLIKYSEKDKAATVIAIDSYLKAGEANPQFDGFESGIILKDSTGKLDWRDSAFLLDEERPKLVGGWAKVYRKDRSRPFYVAVNKRECLKYRRDGSLTEFWTEEKQPSMLRKVALKRALVEAFPSLFAGAISNVEVDYELLPEEVKQVAPKPRGETPEGELPAAYERNGEAYYAKWWVKQKEKGLTEDTVHGILNVASVKADWVEKGRTLEEADGIIDAALQKPTREGLERVKTAIGQALEKTSEAKLEKPKEEKPKTEEPKAERPKRDPESIKTINDLLKACNQDFKMQPKDVYSELNVKSVSEITEPPSECFRRIQAVRV